jgi:hypothetical protein
MEELWFNSKSIGIPTLHALAPASNRIGKSGRRKARQFLLIVAPLIVILMNLSAFGTANLQRHGNKDFSSCGFPLFAKVFKRMRRFAVGRFAVNHDVQMHSAANYTQ